SIFIEEPLLESRIIKNYEKIVKRNDSIYYITLNEGFARLNLAQLQRDNANQNLSTPLLNGIKTNNKALALDQSIEIPFKEAGQIEIAIAAPQLHNPKFFYSLSNGLSGQSNGTLNFQNLQAGSYTLKIWPELNGQRGDQPLNLTFLIKRPWYLSNLMIVVYVLLLFGVIFLVAYINKQKLNKHRRELEERLVKEQERKNQLAERNNLLEEINAKRKELANTTYLAAKRNSSLIDIKNDLEAVKDKGDNQKKVNSIQNKINHIIDAKDNWKVFETTFKEINNDFFQQLLENHPTLSSKDLKLCAYLKMNLSTKEIAPLMAISVRGVEIHRYRLRKKLDLKSGKNLSKYLIKNY
ncbi:MAG: LuxR C-terminal-related transcriptional regulator, partial [Bacteroidota bacterium]|nr:LuxR C-terminal-related transcriptional regulator [Bacteroidota bacterium]